jgi:dual specificity MAP kinase phosphatase
MYCIGNIRCHLQGYINNTFNANEIYQNIYVGDLASASNKEALKEQGITHILSVFNGCYEIYPDDFTYKIIHINDDTWEDISKYFDETNEFIQRSIKNKNNKIMIHCQKGISRSVTILVAYIIWNKNNNKKIEKDNITNEITNIINEIKTHRPIAEPNEGFKYCLKKYIEKINNYN